MMKNINASAVYILTRVLKSAADHMQHRPRIRDQHHQDPGRLKWWDKEMKELKSKKKVEINGITILKAC